MKSENRFWEFTKFGWLNLNSFVDTNETHSHPLIVAICILT
jgi:hypothetical protein